MSASARASPRQSPAPGHAAARHALDILADTASATSGEGSVSDTHCWTEHGGFPINQPPSQPRGSPGRPVLQTPTADLLAAPWAAGSQPPISLPTQHGTAPEGVIATTSMAAPASEHPPNNTGHYQQSSSQSPRLSAPAQAVTIVSHASSLPLSAPATLPRHLPVQPGDADPRGRAAGAAVPPPGPGEQQPFRTFARALPDPRSAAALHSLLVASTAALGQPHTRPASANLNPHLTSSTPAVAGGGGSPPLPPRTAPVAGRGLAPQLALAGSLRHPGPAPSVLRQLHSFPATMVLAGPDLGPWSWVWHWIPHSASAGLPLWSQSMLSSPLNGQRAACQQAERDSLTQHDSPSPRKRCRVREDLDASGGLSVPHPEGHAGLRAMPGATVAACAVPQAVTAHTATTSSGVLQARSQTAAAAVPQEAHRDPQVQQRPRGGGDDITSLITSTTRTHAQAAETAGLPADSQQSSDVDLEHATMLPVQVVQDAEAGAPGVLAPVLRAEETGTGLRARRRHGGRGPPTDVTATVAASGEPVYACSFCDYTHRVAAMVRVHERIHTGNKPYHCTFCPYRSTQAGNVRIHERTHTGERPYGCPLCPYAAASSSKTVQHIRSMHPDASPGTHPALPTRPGRRARGRSCPGE